MNQKLTWDGYGRPWKQGGLEPILKAYDLRTGSLVGSVMADSKASAERREIFFAGRVQGVGFRYTTHAIAARYPVTGFVKNLHDGRVQAVIEGAPAEVDRMLAALTAEMARYITSQNVTTLPATGEFQNFSVRH
jgi:acylphosphatase